MPGPKNREADAMKEYFDIRQSVEKIKEHLEEVLTEDFQYTDKSGKEWKIAGKYNDAEKGTLGTLEAFERESEVYGKPFFEVSRNMESHFKTYCLYRGMTEEDLLLLTQDEISDDMKSKLREYKKDFMKMVIDTDLEQISDMYATIAQKMEKDQAQFQNIAINDPEGIKENTTLFLKYSGSQSWYSQTIDYEGKNCAEIGNKMVAMVDEKLKKAGKDYTFTNMQWPLATVEFLYQSTSKLEEKDLTPDNGSLIVSNKGNNAYIASLKSEMERAENKEGSWLSNVSGKTDDMTDTFGLYFTMSDEDFKFAAGKYQGKAALQEFNDHLKENVVLDHVNNLVNALEKSGMDSHRNSDLSGKMYQQLKDMKATLDMGQGISDQTLEDLKKTATEYLSYKNQTTYNKNAYGKIAAADGILAFAKAYESKDIDTMSAVTAKGVSTDKNAVDKIMASVKKDKNIANEYKADKEKVSYTSLLKDEISESHKKNPGLVKAEKTKEKVADKTKGM